MPIVYGAETKQKKQKIYILGWTAADGSIETQQSTKNGWAQGRRGWRRGAKVGEQEWDANVPHLQVEGERWECSTTSTIGHCWVMMLSTVATMWKHWPKNYRKAVGRGSDQKSLFNYANRPRIFYSQRMHLLFTSFNW